MPNGFWYQQFMPNIGGRQIQDITFTDSLNGYAITSEVSDTSFLLRTTNGGDNWTISHFDTGICSYYNVQFINANTGFVSGFIYNGSVYRLVKTTNGGTSWFYINHTSDIVAIDMHVMSEDTIWLVDSGSLTGGVYRTTNGGASWEQQLNIGSQNPRNIYFYNKDTGFAAENVLYKTTNSGVNWTQLPAGGGFSDMYFVNALTGWKCNLGIQKTTDGGLNWINQSLPQGGNILGNGANRFMNKDNDTIWGVGETIITGGSPPTRGILFRTTNGGDIWQYQLPDTAIHINRYLFGQIINNRIGWAYSFNPTGIHTTSGGDPVWITGIEQVSTEIPKEYKLFQNYPNPFNPSTNIKYQITNNNSFVQLMVFDITGKEIALLINQKQNSGTYQMDFSGQGYSSGVYFYKLTVTSGKEVFSETRKMILIK